MKTIGKVLDNGGRTFDRYAIEFQYEDGSSYWIASGPTGNVPNGVFMSLDFVPMGRVVAFSELPEPVRRAAQLEAGVRVLAGKIGAGQPREFQMIEDAVDWIEEQRAHDNEGVERGDYYIDDMSDAEYSKRLQNGT